MRGVEDLIDEWSTGSEMGVCKHTGRLLKSTGG